MRTLATVGNASNTTVPGRHHIVVEDNELDRGVHGHPDKRFAAEVQLGDEVPLRAQALLHDFGSGHLIPSDHDLDERVGRRLGEHAAVLGEEVFPGSDGDVDLYVWKISGGSTADRIMLHINLGGGTHVSAARGANSVQELGTSLNTQAIALGDIDNARRQALEDCFSSFCELLTSVC